MSVRFICTTSVLLQFKQKQLHQPIILQSHQVKENSEKFDDNAFELRVLTEGVVINNTFIIDSFNLPRMSVMPQPCSARPPPREGAVAPPEAPLDY